MTAMLRALAIVFAGAAIAGAQPPPGPRGGPPARDHRQSPAQTGTDSQGQYQVRGLPPGDYLAVALEYAEDGIWNDPEYLGTLGQSARKVTLRDGQTSTMALTLAKVQ